ncbi:bactofilin family protein [Rhodoligotrophos defluvii]|uniref:bactofilin family protein n=1 Tax=Rhodoligotrophos defluvii TaxID=2561934 RepID=UPI0010C9FE45|nr:polymer-forming cytoskeletal protein [Rhodoligotrophos defluvii]
MIFKGRNRQAPLAATDDGDRGKPQRRAGPSIITADVVIEGKLITSGELQVDGTIHGDVRAANVVIDNHGSIHGEVVAEEIVVRGRIIGPLHALNIHIFAGAHVEGDITHETISIENGAFVEGSIRRSEEPLESSHLAISADEASYFPRDHHPSEALYSDAFTQYEDLHAGEGYGGSDHDPVKERPRLPGTDTPH